MTDVDSNSNYPASHAQLRGEGQAEGRLFAAQLIAQSSNTDGDEDRPGKREGCPARGATGITAGGQLLALS